MRIVPRLFICIIGLAATLAAQPWPVESTKISATAQDTTGHVWGINTMGGGSLSEWEGNTWKSSTPTSVPEHSQLSGLARGSDGAVYGVWNAGANILVTRHQGSSSKLLTRFTGRLQDRPHIFVDAHGNVWLTEQGKSIFRVTPQGQAERIYAIPDSQFREEGRPKDELSAFNPIHATADGRGRIWFWSDCLAGRTPWASMQGVLVFDGEKMEHHPQIAGVPNKVFSIVEPDDAGHMWVAVAEDRLYRIDINTFTATPLPEPDSQAFRFVQRIFRVGQDTFVISGSASQPVPEICGNGRFCALWRLRNGAWTRVVNGLDMAPNSSQQPARPFVTIEGNLWLGAFASGPWCIPDGERHPMLLDWRYDNPLDGSEGLFQLADGRLLISTPSQGTTTASPSNLLTASPAPTEVRTLNPPNQLIQDARNHLLGILAIEGNAFSEWDGQRWTEHPFPRAFNAEEMQIATVDSLGRIWFLTRSAGEAALPPSRITSIDLPFMGVGQPITITLTGTNFGTKPPDLNVTGVTLASPPTILSHSDTKITLRMTITAVSRDGKVNFIVSSNGYGENHMLHGSEATGVAIFDPQRGSFETFPTSADALQAQLPLRQDFHLKANCCLIRSFSSDGRICYLDESLRLRYYDGQTWHQWGPQDISGDHWIKRVYIPFFNRAGNLAITLDEKTWEYTEAAAWRTTSFELCPCADKIEFAPPPVASLACGFTNPESVVRDRLGTYWLAYQRQLYRAIPGLCVAQFSSQERQPFIDSRTVRGAFIDPAGNAFLETYLNTTPAVGEYVILSARRTPTRPKLCAVSDSEGNVQFQFATPPVVTVKFTWRVNDGEWNVPTRNLKNTIPWLPNGKYRLEAMAVDERLQIDPTPSVALVEIRVNPQEQITLLIRKLNDPDYSVRDAAVAALVKRTSAAMPLLQSTREKAGLDQRWWIDAAIQQIEEALAQTGKP